MKWHLDRHCSKYFVLRLSVFDHPVFCGSCLFSYHKHCLVNALTVWLNKQHKNKVSNR